MKKLILTLLLAFLLPVTIFASKTQEECQMGFKKNSLGMCEGRKSSGLSSIPANGKLNSYKDDFECDRGYRKNKDNWSCDEIQLPENAALTVAGNNWTCISQYKREGDKCEKVTLPENAKLHTQGSGFYCNFGYRKENDKQSLPSAGTKGKCIKLELPSNAHWSYDGNDWECNKGFKNSEDGKSCVEIKIPENAQSNYIGTFTCNSGFKKVGDKCEKQPDITNGYFYTIGSDFYCAKGFKKNEEERKCEEIKIPENARRDDNALDGWVCHREFKKEGNECKKFHLPENAHYEANTWKCNLGYRKNPKADRCDKINLPENAKYLETHDGWECNSGYVKNYRESRCDK